jgi:hypothetical protein
MIFKILLYEWEIIYVDSANLLSNKQIDLLTPNQIKFSSKIYENSALIKFEY